MEGRNLHVMIAAAVAWAAVAGPVAAAPAARAQLSSNSKPRNVVALVNILIRKNSKNTEIVSFPDRRLPAVKVVRGKREPPSPPVRHGTTQIVAFADKRMTPVRIMRGGTGAVVAEVWLAAPMPAQRANRAKIEVVSFADRLERPVTVLRGSPVAAIDLDLFAAARSADFDLFSAARGADLDRVAFAVDGAESSHGADLAMWRPEFSGPQGPMQVSAAAASDLGGGDRFDLTQNRLLGRAYLARLYRRYGNWPDAIAAYNWGPGNMDTWINAGRPAAALPVEVERYCDRVLRNGGVLPAPGAPLPRPGWQLRAP
jgi:Transglycosylase SLT domain